ncbi:MAG: alpha/beta hydrolase [Solirubrobacterales bacterium]
MSHLVAPGGDVPPGLPLDPDLQNLVDNLPGGLALPVKNDPVSARNQFRRLTVALRDAQPPANLESIEDISVPGATSDQPARVYTPFGEERKPTILFFHGGGFVVGDVESYDLQVRTIAERTGLTVVSVEYRLAPEDPFPAAADDAESIARWMLAHADNFGDGRVIVMGDSAGGNLAAVVAQNVEGFLAQVLIYPASDFSREYPSLELHGAGPVLTGEAGRLFHAAYLAGGDGTDPRCSPLYGADRPGQPPAVVITCEYDILRDAGIAHAHAVGAAGVPTTHLHYPALTHGFMGMFPLSKACDSAIDEFCAATLAFAN